MLLTGNIVVIEKREIFFGSVKFAEGKIVEILKISAEDPSAKYILPGFIDSHIHIESSMLVPSKFAELAVLHGTTGTISDPHEIANVCGIAGVEYMIADSKTSPLKFHFGAPSCVPSIEQDVAGAVIDARQIEALMQHPDIYYLSEMMNYPGVIFEDEDVLKKITHAQTAEKPIDGHAPGLMGGDAKKYFAHGISTDHECISAEEALGKLRLGVKILIREGSAARNFEALIPLIEEHYQNMMFCSDDKHPDSLLEGHINQLCSRAVGLGYDKFKVLQAACINPVTHYKMRNGLLKLNHPADAIVVDNLQNFNVLETYIEGILVATDGTSLISAGEVVPINNFECDEQDPADFLIPALNEASIKVIEALDGQLVTRKLTLQPKIEGGNLVSDLDQDLIKIIVLNRYGNKAIAKAFVKGTGIRRGALASSVAHDAHNIVAIGANDIDLATAVNLVIRAQGGVSAAFGDQQHILPLKIAGLMSEASGKEVAAKYAAIESFAKEEMKSTLAAPFMTLSFLALPVIPQLKIISGGLFDVDKFEFTSLQ